MDAVEHFEALKGILREHVVSALTAKNFEGVHSLTEILEELEQLQEKVAPWAVIPGATEGQPPNEAGSRQTPSGGESHDRASPGTQQASADRPLPGAKDDRYPRYFIENGSLIRQALRNDKTTTYEQRMSHPQFLRILEDLRRMIPNKTEFHATEVAHASEAPAYHVYMTLGVLQEAGYVDIPKRGLYRFLKTTEDPWATAVWDDVGTGSFT